MHRMALGFAIFLETLTTLINVTTNNNFLIFGLSAARPRDGHTDLSFSSPHQHHYRLLVTDNGENLGRIRDEIPCWGVDQVIIILMGSTVPCLD